MTDTPERDPLLAYPVTGPMRLEGVGSLWAARSAATGKRVWLRRVPHSAVAQEAIDTALAVPRHRALCSAIECGTWKGEAWLVADFPEGQLLGDASDLRGGTLPNTFGALAQALSELHLHGLTHGMLSGEAVLISADGSWSLFEVPMLALNRATDRRPEQTALSHLHRTAAFFSPERLKGAAPSPEDDVFALGVLLSLATGGARPPAGSALEQVHAIMTGAWKPTVAATLSADLAGLIQAMTSVERARRPTAASVAKQLTTPEEAPAIPLPVPTAPGMPTFDAAPLPVASPSAPEIAFPEVAHVSLVPAPAPTVPMPVRASFFEPAPAPARIQVGGAALVGPPTLFGRFTAFTISIAASDGRLVSVGLLAVVMIASTVAFGAHVISAREEAREVATPKAIKPIERKEQRYTAEQLKQILRQKEEAHHEY